MKKQNYSWWFMVVLFAVATFSPIELGEKYYILAILPLYVAILNINILKKALYFRENAKKIQIFIDKYGEKKGMILFSVMFIILPILLTALIAYSGHNLL